jgi:hypothetical protein
MQKQSGGTLMSERTFNVGSVYVDHEPDFTNEVDGNGVKHSIELPGFVEIGVVVDGVKVPLTRQKAGNLLPQLDKAKANAAKAAEAAPPAPPEQ